MKKFILIMALCTILLSSCMSVCTTNENITVCEYGSKDDFQPSQPHPEALALIPAGILFWYVARKKPNEIR